VADIAPTPLQLVHGDQDEIIPAKMSHELYAAAREPKHLHIVAGGRHNTGWRELDASYVETIVAFLRGEPQSTNAAPPEPRPKPRVSSSRPTLRR
jgi:hypothetical protein